MDTHKRCLYPLRCEGPTFFLPVPCCVYCLCCVCLCVCMRPYACMPVLEQKEAPGTTALLKTLPSEVLADILLDSA